jgi:hypothetical protein
MKSERLKKLESELEDLQHWEKLGLVPKKELEKHKEEIKGLKSKIEEEKERLRFMKEHGEMEGYVTPKKNPSKQPYAEPQTLPDMEAPVENETAIEMESEATDTSHTMEEGVTVEEGEEGAAPEEEEEEEEDPFSDSNRWKRGILEDPDVDNW